MNDRIPSAKSCRVLLLLPNWLGDVVMATGLLQLLHDHRELADGRHLHLTLGVRLPWAPLFRDDPRCDDLLEVDKTGRHGGVPGLWRLSRDLACGRFAAVVLGPPSLRVALAAALAHIPLRVGYRSDGRGFLLNEALPTVPRGQVHYADEMSALGRRLLDRLGGPTPPAGSSSGIALPDCRQLAPALPAAVAPRWILAPGATYGQAKTWPLARAAEFARGALSAGGELVLLGDEKAAGFAADLAREVGAPTGHVLTGRPGLVDLTGRTSLAAVVGVLKSAQAFVGNDSGLMHLAAALAVPTVGLFGSSNPRWTAPVGPRTLALAATGFPCQPCYRRTCNQATFCLDTLGGEVVLERLRELLAGHPEPGKGPP